MKETIRFNTAGLCRRVASAALLCLSSSLLTPVIAQRGAPGSARKAAPGAAQKEVILVSGTVHSEKGEVLPELTVRQKNGPAFTNTDKNGIFQIRVPAEDTLILSHVGYDTKEVPVAGKRVLDIVLSISQAALKDVVVVGYGTQKKISVTGAVSSIPVSELQQTATPSLSNAIGGKIPGIITRQSIGEPGYDAASVFIRGLSTWVNSAPLILVDGVERSMDNINAQEIESFTILKDASATAVYGVRGANGVILINTKRGKAGKPTVTFRSESAELQSLRLPQYINSFEYASLMNEAQAYDGQAPRWTPDQLQKYKDGSDPNFYPDVDWTKTVLRNTTGQSINNLSVNGGSDIIRYFTNVGYTLQNGIYKEDKANPYPTNAGIKRYNFRSNVDVNLSKSLTMQLGIGGIIQSGNYPGGGSSYDIFNTLRIVPPFAFPVLNPDGTVAGSPAYPGSVYNQNPWGEVTQSGYSTQDRSTLQGTFGAKWDLSKMVTKGLSVNGKFSYDRYSEIDNNRPKLYTVEQYLGKDPGTGEDLYNLIREEQPMSYGVASTSNRAIYQELQLNYERSIQKHTVSAMVLYNQRDYVDLTSTTSLENLPYRQQGIAGRATYDFANRYLAEFDFGYNGSENFAPGKRFGFFPSISGGWVISNEKFWHVKAVNNLKIRGSHGKVGNDQVGGPRFLYLTTVNTAGQSYEFGQNQEVYSGIDENITGNVNASWEVDTKNNIGLDADLFDSKITIQVDAYNEKRTGILMQRATVPDLTGFYPWSLPYGNLGIVKNKGIDGLITFKNTTSGGFYYSFRGNFTFARNSIIENDEPALKYPYLSQKQHPIGQPFGLVADGLYKDQEDIAKSPRSSFVTNVRPGDIKYRDINGDGVIDAYDEVAIGYSRTPEISYGLGGTIAYKGFDLSLYFTGAAHTSIFLDGYSMWPFYDGEGQDNVLKEYYNNRWTPQTPNAKYPAIDEGNNPNNFQTSTLWMRNGDYIRLKTAEIGYSFSRRLMGRLGISKLRLFANGTNLLTWDHVKIIDPESENGSGNYPLQRILNGGLQVDFK